MRIKRSHFILAVAAVLFIYYVLIAGLLHCSLDRFLFLHNTPEQTTELALEHITDRNGNEIIVRYYGKGKKGSVIFFPGQHGGIRKYENICLPHLILKALSWLQFPILAKMGQEGMATLKMFRGLFSRHFQELTSCIQ